MRLARLLLWVYLVLLSLVSLSQKSPKVPGYANYMLGYEAWRPALCATTAVSCEAIKGFFLVWDGQALDDPTIKRNVERIAPRHTG